MLFWTVCALILIAFIFDYINGFHDAANSIATVVSTRVLSPGKAVVWAAFFNFIAAFVFGTGVAQTIGKGTVDITIVTLAVICAGLVGAIAWSLITWWLALPTSSSHALVSGIARHNRQTLKSYMQAAGFRPYAREWWHFELVNEPFNRDGFDFEVSDERSTR